MLSPQIFEWCHFASVSGLLSSSLADSLPTLVSSGVEKELTDAELLQLDGLYTQLIPQYKYLCMEYDKAVAQINSDSVRLGCIIKILYHKFEYFICTGVSGQVH